MKPDLFPVAVPSGALAIVARPRGGDWLQDEMRALREARIDILVSALTEEEERELELIAEERFAAEAGMTFRRLRIPDRDAPAEEMTTIAVEFLRELAGDLRRGSSIAAHCRMGLGRSAMIVASLLILTGTEADDAFTAVAKSRGFSVPDTAAQRKWVADNIRTR